MHTGKALCLLALTAALAGVSAAIIQENCKSRGELDPKTSVEVMRLIRDLCEQRAIPVIINMHDVELARRFADRILGMSQGALVYDGPLAGLSDAQLKAIYGGQDWLHS